MAKLFALFTVYHICTADFMVYINTSGRRQGRAACWCSPGCRCVAGDGGYVCWENWGRKVAWEQMGGTEGKIPGKRDYLAVLAGGSRLPKR